MSAFKTYKGVRFDLQHYSGKSIINFQVSLFNDDDTAYDLSIYDDIIIKIFQKRHGHEVLSFSIGDGITLPSPIENVMYWDANYEDMDLHPKYYYHECYGVLGSPDEQELLFHGVSEVI